MKNRYEINSNNEIIRNDSGTYTAENYVETYENLTELFVNGIPKYYLKDGTITERTESELLAILEVTERETYRKAYCQREIRKVYTQENEFKLQRKGILYPEDKEFVEYFNAIETIIKNSKLLQLKDLL